MGEYWDPRVQIDVVGVRDDGWVDLGECKWGRVRSPTTLEREIDDKAALFPSPLGASICRRVFAAHGSSSDASRRAAANRIVRWHSLSDLYA
ncbi:MAG: hypothetical protein HY744_01280 [Deltaproteobacteria bacterium]|nr:hypothetical protein [Deltaproteobacteria bacterium]